MTIIAIDDATTSLGVFVGTADTGELVGNFEGIEVVGLTLGAEL